MRAASASAAGNRAELFPCQSEELKVDPVQTFIVISLHSPNAAAVINQTNLSLITQAFSNFMCQSQEVKVDRDTSTFKFLSAETRFRFCPGSGKLHFVCCSKTKRRPNLFGKDEVVGYFLSLVRLNGVMAVVAICQKLSNPF